MSQFTEVAPHSTALLPTILRESRSSRESRPNEYEDFNVVIDYYKRHGMDNEANVNIEMMNTAQSTLRKTPVVRFQPNLPKCTCLNMSDVYSKGNPNKKISSVELNPIIRNGWADNNDDQEIRRPSSQEISEPQMTKKTRNVHIKKVSSQGRRNDYKFRNIFIYTITCGACIILGYILFQRTYAAILRL